MSVSTAIFSFSGALSRIRFLTQIISMVGAAFVFSIAMGIIRDGGELPVLLSVVIALVVGFSYIILIGMMVRRVRDIFGTPVFENLNSILMLIWAILPGIGFIAWILFCLIPGKVTEPRVAKSFKENSRLK